MDLEQVTQSERTPPQTNMQISMYEDYKTREGTRRVGRGPMRCESGNGILGWESSREGQKMGKKRDIRKIAAL